MDPEDRALVISCGAALFFLRAATRHFGYTDEVRAFPNPDDPDLLAEVCLGRESIEANTPDGGALGVAAGRLMWDPMHFVMVQRMLQGIKERAEGQLLVPPALEVAARIGWVLAGLGLTGLFLTRRRGYLWLLIPLAAASPFLAFTADPNAALAGFLPVGITVWGALVFGRRWWSGYALIAAGVLLVLVLARDAYAVFGVLFDLIVATVLLAMARNRRQDAIIVTTLTRWEARGKHV